MSPIPKGSTVLVTGANGYLASHVVDQLLARGYKVTGTARSAEKGAWLTEYFSQKYSPEAFTLAVVPDMGAPSAFDEAMKGCAGVAHVASDLSFSPDPDVVIPNVINGLTNVLSSAKKTEGLVNFVLTSSSAAAAFPVPEKKFQITKDSWNEFSAKEAYTGGGGYHVYCASKVAGEKALWKYMRENPDAKFTVNAVLPNFIMGKVLGREWGQAGSTGGAVVDLYAGKGKQIDQAMGMLKMVPPQWAVDVADAARLHVAALTDPDISNERIFGFAHTYNNNELLAVLRRAKPDHKFPDDFDDNNHDLSEVVPRARAEEILKKNFGQGFKELEQSVTESVEGL